MAEESSTWSIFEADQRSKKQSVLGLASDGDLKRETESLIVVPQNQSIRTNLVEARIDKSV